MRAAIVEIKVGKNEPIDNALERLSRALKKNLTAAERKRIKDKNRWLTDRKR